MSVADWRRKVKKKKKQRNMVCHIFDMTTGNYMCNFISVRHLELLIMFPMMTSSEDVQLGKMTNES